MFASELTALLEVTPQLRELDPRAIDAFFVFAYVPGPGTIVPRRAPAAARAPAELGARRRRCARAALVVAARGSASARAGAASRRSAPRPSSCSASRCARGWSPTCPVGVFLSGGVDSTLVAVAAAEESSQRLKTFTVGYDVGVGQRDRSRRGASPRISAASTTS